MGGIDHFTKLLAWQKNHELVLEIYKITQKFPKTELFGLTSQIRRSSSSITANLAEALVATIQKIKYIFIIKPEDQAQKYKIK